jgi:hypothetical protein
LLYLIFIIKVHTLSIKQGTIMKKFLCVLILSLFGFSKAQSQSLAPNGIIESDTNWCEMGTIEPIILPDIMYKTTNNDKTIKVVFNIYWAEQLANTYIPEEYVIDAFNDMVEAFIGTGIYFELQEIRYVNYNDLPYDYGVYLINGQHCIPNVFMYPGYTTQVFNSGYNPEEYMNIYVVHRHCNNGVAGWAYVPPYGYYSDGHAVWGDGVWVKSRNFGNENHPGMSTSFYKNRVLIHEVGHYLGLYHTFQNTSECVYPLPNEYYYGPSGCYTTGDLVCDTAPTKISYTCQRGCPTDLNFQNTPWANYQPINHMGYYTETCRNEFTLGQIERMHSYLEAYRPDVFSFTECPADFNGDGIVGTADMLIILACMGADDPECDLVDLDNNGVITIFDFLAFLGYYEQVCDPFYFEVKPSTKPEKLWNLKY